MTHVIVFDVYMPSPAMYTHLRGQYLEFYDPHYNLVEIKGPHDVSKYLRWTRDITKARKFETATEAMACWHEQSRTIPFRYDGYPNKPLTAYSVDIQKVEE